MDAFLNIWKLLAPGIFVAMLGFGIVANWLLRRNLRPETASVLRTVLHYLSDPEYVRDPRTAAGTGKKSRAAQLQVMVAARIGVAAALKVSGRVLSESEQMQISEEVIHDVFEKESAPATK